MTYYDLIFEPKFAFFIMTLSSWAGMVGYRKTAFVLFGIAMIVFTPNNEITQGLLEGLRGE